MPVRYHSRVFVATRTVRNQIDAAAFPPHPATAITPTTSAAEIGRDNPGEWVTVVNEVGEDGEIRWVTMPTGRQEEFLLRVGISSNVPGVADTDVEDRLEVLAEVVQALWMDPATGVFTPPPFPGVFELGGVSQVQYAIWPTDQGFAGSAELVVRVTARI